MAPTSRSFRPALFAALLLCWCTPLRDLDSASSGRGGAGGERPTGGTGGSTLPGIDAGTGGAVDGGGAPGIDVGTGGVVLDAAAGGAVASAGGAGGRGGAAGVGAAGSAPTGGAGGGLAPELPDLTDSPVQGAITYSAGASWDIDGTQWPAFEIHTPTANYWLVKAAAAMVSITDASGLQWINFSSGFRPNRGVPNLGGCCQPGNPTKLGLPTMTTELDPSFTVNSGHLRLLSKSADASYLLVWDFFLTHFTLTINRAPAAFGFTYRGVPGGSIGATDQLVLSSGTARAANLPYSGDLPGPTEWVYLTHPATSHSLFLIQHRDDALPETYQIADLDTPMFTFGDGQIVATPIRFSLGLVDSCADQAVRSRITYVSNAIH